MWHKMESALLMIITVCCTAVVNSQLTTRCSANLRSSECLADVKGVLTDENRFWFGSSYSIYCSPTNLSRECNNRDTEHLSIITRLRHRNDNRTDSITQVLNVTYDAPAGSYQACGKTYQVLAYKHTIDPTNRTSLPLWTLDHLPHVSWTESETNSTYSLLIYDAAPLILHGLYINVKGSDLSTGEPIYTYRGPKNPLDRDQPYVFALYVQPKVFNVSWATDVLLAANPGLAPFIVDKVLNASGLNLTGPIGASVLVVTTDEYAAASMRARGTYNNCPKLITPAFSSLPLAYDVKSVTLSISVDLTFTSPEIHVSTCCVNATYVSTTRTDNPLDNGYIAPVFTRLQPEVKFVQTNLRGDTYFYFRNKYTLLMLDVTDELAHSNTTNLFTILHWQVVNIREGLLKTGVTTQSYFPPTPFTGLGLRTALFLLLQQSSDVNVTDLTRFTDTSSSCPPLVQGRCRFNLTSFIQELQMTIVGATWFVTSTDLYSRDQVQVKGLQSTMAACAGMAEYANPCRGSSPTDTSKPQSPTCGSPVTRASLYAFLLAVVLSYIWKKL